MKKERQGKIAAGLLVVTILVYAAGVASRNAFVYILCFYIMAAAIMFGLLVVVTNQIWNLPPGHFKKAHEGNRVRLNAIIFFSILLFFFIRAIVTAKCLPRDASAFISLLRNTATFVFVAFFAWNLIRRSKTKTMVAGGIIFILFISLLLFINLTASRSGEISEIDSVEKLKSLGYVSWAPVEKESDVEKTGVILFEAGVAFNGINIYTSNIDLPEAYLIDMHGNVVHKWAKNIKGGDAWRHVAMCENGDLLAVAWDQMLIRLDWDSNVIWKRRMRAHHDVSVDESQNIYVLGREDSLVFWHGIPVPILGDYIAVLSPSGEIKKKVYIYDIVKEKITLRSIAKIYRRILNPKNMRMFYDKAKTNYFLMRDTCFDIMHMNSLEVMSRGIDGFCKKGDLLISLRMLDLIGVVDAEKEEFIWTWGPGELDKQHHPTLLKNGNVLIFDNGFDRGFTRIIELNTFTNEIVWEYKSKPQEAFYSGEMGSCQGLPNGNTLITESEKGHVFEVTKEGDVVWEFYNPEVKREEKERAAIYRMMRICNFETQKLLPEHFNE